MRLSAAAWISHGRVQRRLGWGPRNRLDLLRNLLTGLLIDYAKCGDSDPKAMRMANFWLTEKDLIHKLFKVLAPRFQPYSRNYTQMLQIPNRDRIDRAKMAVIEFKGNPFPPLPIPRRDSEKTLVNQLLKGYRDDVWQTKRPAS
ncbi:39S ribosomal protein L17, mitochondrial isoform X2 [Sphaerodactylus townsendi]|uniref:39S ribosomal protein L17, mitochondrial isoform X2 n=1 Tax=Sphaerodactylus townsendi TaxID=933632 RepID=UPI0020261CFE|nr:39S ribosomal protein L17, mitochondrial isoform X2 [Sphaerodactylus townsendi]